jgi:hypothetical protein
VHRGEVGEERAHRLRVGLQPHGHVERDAEAPLRADEGAEQVVALRLAVGPAERRHGAVGEERRHGDDVFSVTPYFRQCGPPAFSATLPPIVHAVWLDGSGA